MDKIPVMAIENIGMLSEKLYWNTLIYRLHNLLISRQVLDVPGKRKKRPCRTATSGAS